MIKEKITIKGVLTTESGLHIGGTKDDIGISALDNPVIKDALTNAPYIPGSSIKGKMRSLFETSGFAKGKTLPCGCGDKDCIVCKMFGAHRNTNAQSGASRVIFRDAYLTSDFENMTDITEIKTETAIDRSTGTAQRGSLRQSERVSAGVEFNYEINILVHEGDNADELYGMVKAGLKMIEATGLGGKVSAGYGKVNFHIDEEGKYSVTKSKFSEV